jgi:hypothetical protein
LDAVGLGMLGRFTDINLARTATLTGGAWSVDLPLANLLDESRYRGKPSRQLTPAVLAASQFDCTLSTPKGITLVAILFHTLSLAARYRLSIAAPGGSLAAPVYQTAWSAVYPAVYDQTDLEYEDSNWWTGQLAVEDLDLYPRHLWIALSDPVIAAAIRLEFDDATNAAGSFDLGGLWVASTWSPEFNYERGRVLNLDPRDQRDESPSGREFGEERTPRRRLQMSWSRLSDDEARRLYDAGARARTTRPVIFAPDLEDPRSTLREAFPATFADDGLPAPTFTYPGLGRVSATLKEIIA